MTEAIIGYGSKFEAHNGDGSPGTYFEFDEVKTITPPNEEQEQLDATHMQSPGRTREFIPGFINPGSMSVEMNFIPGSDTDDYVVDWRAAGSTKTCRVTVNDKTWVFDAFPTSYETPISNEDVLVATLNLQVAGQVLRGS